VPRKPLTLPLLEVLEGCGDRAVSGVLPDSSPPIWHRRGSSVRIEEKNDLCSKLRDGSAVLSIATARIPTPATFRQMPTSRLALLDTVAGAILTAVRLPESGTGLAEFRNLLTNPN